LKIVELDMLGFWRNLYFQNKGIKIKEKEKISDVIKQGNSTRVFGSHKLTLGLRINA
jgi:hypothetical protein